MTNEFCNLAGLARVINQEVEHLRPPPDLSPSQWAERNIKIPIGNAIPGLIRFDNAPYQREPLDMTISPDCYRITLMWAAQSGKTQLALCTQAYHIIIRPQSQMMMQPSQSDLNVWLNSKFNPMSESNEEINNRIAKPRGRDGVNNSSMKSYPGGFLMFAWSGSPKTMRGRSAPLIIADEIDGYDTKNIDGHPVSLLWQRAATFGDKRKLIEISTPTIKDISYIEKAFNDGDQRRFYVPCPHCNKHQVLSWGNVIWEGKEAPKSEQKPSTAAYVCAECGVMLGDGDRKAAVRLGEWRSAKSFRGHASYHINELYSTFRSLKDIVQGYLDRLAVDDLQSFVNSSLAETWEEQGEEIESDELAARASKFTAEVPDGGLVLTAGVDMQQDRLECEVVAWGRGEESWSVDYQVLWGDPLSSDVWDDLIDLLNGSYKNKNGLELKIKATCVDTGGSGGSTQAAYEWLRDKKLRRIFGIKGIGGWNKPIVSAVTRKRSGRSKRRIDLFMVAVDEAKLTVMRRFKIKQPGAGYCHFPDHRNKEWFEQLAAEKLVTRFVKGFPRREWHKTKDRNEGLDCRVYAFAALKILNPSFKAIQNRQEKVAIDKKDQEGRVAQKRIARKKTKNWANNW